MARMKIKSEKMKRTVAALQKKDEPIVTPENYQSSLISYLNWHAANTNTEQMRSWVKQYITDKKQFAIINKATDFELRTLGLLVRLKMRDDYLSDTELARIDSIIDDLNKKYKPIKTEKKIVKNTISPMERTKAIISNHIANLEFQIDEFLTNNVDFDIKDYIAKNNLTPMAMKAIAKHFSVLRDELSELLKGQCADLKEGYSFIKRIDQKKFFQYIENIIAACNHQLPRRKQSVVRQKKVKPAANLVASLRYQETDLSLNIKSEKPEKIIGATEAWLYDTVKRQVVVLKAKDGETLTVSGTTIKNFDETVSGRKTIRKPEVLNNRLTNKYLNVMFNNLKSKVQVARGRTNENMLILGVKF